MKMKKEIKTRGVSVVKKIWDFMIPTENILNRKGLTDSKDLKNRNLVSIEH